MSIKTILTSLTNHINKTQKQPLNHTQTTPPHTHRAFTLIEILLVVSVITIITISSVSGFLMSSERIQFHNNVSDIKTYLTLSRTIAFNDQDQENQYEINISRDSLQTLKYNIKQQTKPTTVDQLKIGKNEHYTIDFILGLQQSDKTWTDAPNDTKITVNTQLNKCEISSQIANQNYLILHIKASQPSNPNANKHIYIHRENCLLETLSSPLNI